MGGLSQLAYAFSFLLDVYHRLVSFFYQAKRSVTDSNYEIEKNGDDSKRKSLKEN